MVVVLERCRQAMTPGALTVHEITVCDLDRVDPVDGFEHPAEDWPHERARRAAAPASPFEAPPRLDRAEAYQNRWLIPDYVAYLQRLGLEVVRIEPLIRIDSRRIRTSRMAPPFRDRPASDFETVRARVTARLGDRRDR